MVKLAVPHALLPVDVSSMTLSRVEDDGQWYYKWPDDVKALSRAFENQRILPKTPHWTFIQNKSIVQNEQNKRLRFEELSSTRNGMEEAMEQDTQVCATNK